MPNLPLFGIPVQIHQYTSTYSAGNGESYMRYRSVVFVNVGEYFHQTQEYVAWCSRDADGNLGQPLRTFDVPVGQDGLMIPQMADGEIVNPQDVYDIDGVDEPMNGESQVIAENPDKLEDEEDEFEDMNIDDEEEIGEIAEVGSDVEIEAEEDDELGLYLDSESELDSEDERIAVEAMDSESEVQEGSSEESSESSYPDWEP